MFFSRIFFVANLPTESAGVAASQATLAQAEAQRAGCGAAGTSTMVGGKAMVGPWGWVSMLKKM